MLDTNKTESENLINKQSNTKTTSYSELDEDDNVGIIGGTDGYDIIGGVFSGIDSVKTIIVILFIVFECIPIIMGGYILNTNYSLYFVLIFGASLFGIICVAKEKFHYVLIMLFTYAMYIFILFIIAFDAYRIDNAEKYHIEKLKTVSTLWIILQIVIGITVYMKCCKPE